MLYEEVVKELKDCKKLKEKLESEILQFPQGKLRISVSGHSTRYYVCKIRGDTVGTYLRKARKL